MNIEEDVDTSDGAGIWGSQQTLASNLVFGHA